MLKGSILFILLATSSPVFDQGVRPQAADSSIYPRLVHAEVPSYPPVPWTVRFGGTLEIEVTITNGIVVDAHVLNGTLESEKGSSKVFTQAETEKLLPYLEYPSLKNVKTWEFMSQVNTNIVVTYIYGIEGEETLTPENPKVELELPYKVKIIARPCKPTSS